MDLIFTDPKKVDQGVLLDYELDLAFGKDENNFECRIQSKSHCCEAGSLLYVEGTEYGGIVDSIESDSENDEVVYRGRTWHGILNSKVIEPLKAEDLEEPDEPTTYTITASVTGGIASQTVATVNEGESLTITFTPTADYVLKSVTVDGVAIDKNAFSGSYTFANVTENHHIEVVYVDKITYTITASVTGGTVDPESAIVEEGHSQTFVFTANTGFAVQSVMVDGQTVDIDTFTGSYTFENVTENHTIAVVYSEPNKHTVKATVKQGQITCGSDWSFGEYTAYVSDGESVTFQFSPTTGHVGLVLKSVTVDGVEIDKDSFTGTYTFSNVTENHTIDVVYYTPMYEATATVVGGTVDPESAGTSFGGSLTFTFTPYDGYVLESVTVDGEAIDISTFTGVYTFTMVSANHTIHVVYVEEITGKALSEYTEGDIVYINENGSPVPFYVAKHDYESALNGAGRTLLVRKECHSKRKWHETSGHSAYATSDIDSWLNNGYKALLDAAVQNAIGSTSFYYTVGGGTSTQTTLSRSVFLLSLYECGKAPSAANKDGSELPIADTLDIATLDGTKVEQWTRSVPKTSTTNAYRLSTSGMQNSSAVTTSSGVRPCFTLPADAVFNADTDAFARVPAVASTFSMRMMRAAPVAEGTELTIKETDSKGNSLIGKYLVISGDANKCMKFCLSRIGLSGLFAASEAAAGVDIEQYQFHRYTDAYTGIVKMLASAGLKLKVAFQEGRAVLSAVEKRDYTQDEEFNSDLVQFQVVKRYNTVNHLICLGSGEMENRTVIHLYADEHGNISQEKTQTDLDEYVDILDYPNAESDEELLKSGKERLKSLWSTDELSIDFDATEDIYDVGDIVGALDYVTGITVSAPIAKKIVTIQNGQTTISYKVGE